MRLHRVILSFAHVSSSRWKPNFILSHRLKKRRSGLSTGKERFNWYVSLGIKKENLRFRDHEIDERAHYATMATDVRPQGPWGWDEFMGIHYRGDWDLSRHQSIPESI